MMYFPSKRITSLPAKPLLTVPAATVPAAILSVAIFPADISLAYVFLLSRFVPRFLLSRVVSTIPPAVAGRSTIPAVADRSTIPAVAGRSTVPAATISSTVPPARVHSTIPPATVRSSIPPATVRSSILAVTGSFHESSCHSSFGHGASRKAPIQSFCQNVQRYMKMSVYHLILSFLQNVSVALCDKHQSPLLQIAIFLRLPGSLPKLSSHLQVRFMKLFRIGSDSILIFHRPMFSAPPSCPAPQIRTPDPDKTE